MFNNLSRQLKQSTDRLRHQLADQADQTEGETPSPAADPDTQATTVTGNDRRSPRGPEIAPVQIRSLPNGGYEIINPATGKAVVLSRQGDADAPVAEGGVPNLDTMTENSSVTETEAESLATPLATAVVEKEEEETETLSPP